MARPNIVERREYVEDLLDQGIKFNLQKMRQVGAMFGCSHSAIRADIMQLTKTTDMSVHLTPNMRKQIYKRDGHKCQYCGTTEAYEFIIEHVIPASMDGVAKPYNLVVACQSCNVKKGRSVWIPNNLGIVTKGHKSWRKKIIELSREDN
jgi:hypothetical protein